MLTGISSYRSAHPVGDRAAGRPGAGAPALGVLLSAARRAGAGAIPLGFQLLDPGRLSLFLRAIQARRVGALAIALGLRLRAKVARRVRALAVALGLRLRAEVARRVGAL